MMCWRIVLLCLLQACGFAVAAAEGDAGQSRICPGFVLVRPPAPPLEDAEIRMICGFPAAAGTPAAVWTEIPRNQALSSLRAALQKRGYHRPLIREHGEFVEIDPGPLTYVRSVRAFGAPPGFEVRRRRGVIGELLTPAALDDLEAWSRETLQRLGFPCPQVSSLAGATEGVIELELDPGSPRSYGEVRVDGAPPRLAAQLGRLHAFRAGWSFQRAGLEASAARLVATGVVEQAQLVPGCEGEDGIRADIVPGLRRLLSLQLAFDTEELLRLHGRFVQRTLPGRTLLLSTVETSLSWRLQELAAQAQWYAGATPSRFWFEPGVAVRRRDERPFESIATEARFAFGIAGDRQSWGWRVRAGPRYAVHRTRDGFGPDRAEVLSLGVEAEAASHRYEVYRAQDLQRGWVADARALLADAGFAADFGAVYVEAGGALNIDVRGDDPPSLMLGLRGRVGTTFTGEDPAALPPEWRHHLGGAADLRGFSRLALPGDRRGALTRVTLGLELRPGLSVSTLQPLVFIDAGMLGREEASLDGNPYWSTGGGLAWESPVGPLRATLANGWAGSDDEGPQLFLAWGRTF